MARTTRTAGRGLGGGWREGRHESELARPRVAPRCAPRLAGRRGCASLGGSAATDWRLGPSRRLPAGAPPRPLRAPPRPPPPSPAVLGRSASWGGLRVAVGRRRRAQRGRREHKGWLSRAVSGLALPHGLKSFTVTLHLQNRPLEPRGCREWSTPSDPHPARLVRARSTTG